MANALLHKSEQLYGFLLKLYPKNFKQQFGQEMQFVFSEQLADSYSEHGDYGIVSLWSRTVIDASKSIISQHLVSQKGGHAMKTKHIDIMKDNKIFLLVALVTALILSIPLVAMQFTSEVDWKLGDFFIMGTLIFGTGSMFVITARQIRSSTYRVIVGLAFLFALLLVWAELAVGVFGTPFAGS